MLTITWRRLRSPAAWAFILVMSAPMLAEAQQGGLFPLAPIRRERVPCEMENPIYGLYRNEYFGYHPTCWRRFPSGWGCPSPEAPNAAASFKERPRDPASLPPPLGDEDPGMDLGDPLDSDGGEGMRPDENQLPDLPAVPEGGARSPFPTDTGPERAPEPRREAPAENPRNPLDLLPPPEEVPANRPASPAAAEVTPDESQVLPPLSYRNSYQPELAVKDPTARPVSMTRSTPGYRTNSSPSPSRSARSSSEVPAQAPRRTGLFGGLFGGLNRTRR